MTYCIECYGWPTDPVKPTLLIWFSKSRHSRIWTILNTLNYVIHDTYQELGRLRLEMELQWNLVNTNKVNANFQIIRTNFHMLTWLTYFVNSFELESWHICSQIKLFVRCGLDKGQPAPLATDLRSLTTK